MRSGGLLQREIERAGISTVSISNVPDQTERLCAPRAAFIQYPFGRLLGDVGDREGQRAVCDDLVELLQTAESPNTYHHLPYEWHQSPEETKWHPAVPAPIHAERKRIEAESKNPAQEFQKLFRDEDREL